jgi:hypothetical protein
LTPEDDILLSVASMVSFTWACCQHKNRTQRHVSWRHRDIRRLMYVWGPCADSQFMSEDGAEVKATENVSFCLEESLYIFTKALGWICYRPSSCGRSCWSCTRHRWTWSSPPNLHTPFSPRQPPQLTLRLLILIFLHATRVQPNPNRGEECIVLYVIVHFHGPCESLRTGSGGEDGRGLAGELGGQGDTLP